MKRLLCVLVSVVLMLACFTACNFHTTTNDSTGKTAADSLPQVEKLLSVLSSGNVEDALQMLHPDVQKNANHAMQQNSAYMQGRKVTSVETLSCSVYTSKGTAGNIRQEKASFKVTFGDGEVVAVSAVYHTDKAGAGFTTFQIVLGAI